MGNSIVYVISQELKIVCFNLFLLREVVTLQITQSHTNQKKIKVEM